MRTTPKLRAFFAAAAQKVGAPAAQNAAARQSLPPLFYRQPQF